MYIFSFSLEITLDQTKNELEKIKQEKTDLETKLQSLKTSDVSILTTAKNRMEKKYHEKDLELAKAIGKKHAFKKYDHFSLNTSCFWESTSSNIIPVCSAISPKKKFQK